MKRREFPWTSAGSCDGSDGSFHHWAGSFYVGMENSMEVVEASMEVMKAYMEVVEAPMISTEASGVGASVGVRVGVSAKVRVT